MRRERNRQAIRLRIKLRLLALVLALLLTWYAFNPAPGPVRHRRRRPERLPPDAKRREVKAMTGRALALLVETETIRAADDSIVIADEDPDELDWPEYISLD